MMHAKNGASDRCALAQALARVKPIPCITAWCGNRSRGEPPIVLSNAPSSRLPLYIVHMSHSSACAEGPTLETKA